MRIRIPGVIRISLVMSVLVGAWPSLSLAEDIVIGIPATLSGANAMTGRMERNSYLLAVDEINAAGGINGETLQLDIRNTRGDPGVARSIVNHFINVKRYPMIVGTSGSVETSTIAALCERKGIPFLAVSGADESITQRGYLFTFRINPSLHAYPTGVIGFLEQVVRPERLAVIFEQSDFAREIASVLSSAGDEHGWKVNRFVYEFGTRNFLPLLDQIGKFGPDAVFLMSYAQDAPLIIDYLRENDPDLKVFISGLPSQTQSRFSDVFGDYGDRLFVMSIWSPKLPYSGAGRYYNKYVKRFGSEPDYHGAQAYAAIYVLADALRRSPTLGPEDIREALAATNRRTAFGNVRFNSDDEYQNQNMPPTYVLQMIDGSLEVVWPSELKTAQYILWP